ncbi:MAG: transposase [Campylobacterota bacterium]|nr:transposase [Campylobacterota bacterium]
MAIPIVGYLLKKTTKQGNSGFRDRIRVVKKFIDIFGKDRIEVLTADREFVGEVWFKWLKKRDIPFAIRVMNNKKVKVGRGDIRVDTLFRNLKKGEFTFYRTKKTIYGYEGLSLIALKMKDEYLIIATNIKQEMALGFYKRRWEIEMLFSALKKKRF